MNTLTKLVALAAVAVLATSAFAQRGGGQGRGGGFGGQRGGFGQAGNMLLVQRADVKADLGITSEQTTKIEALLTAQLEEMRAMRQGGGGGGGGGGDREAMMAARAKMTEATDKKLNEILTPTQTKRLLEINVQLSGNRALLLPAVQKALALTESQLGKVKELQAKQMEAMRSIGERMRNGEIDREQSGELRTKNDKILGDELAKILTADQAAKLKAMAGKPFKADIDG